MEVDEEGEERQNIGIDEEFEKLFWSIDDDTLFYPLGLTNHGTSAGKTVFVTWCEDYLINFVFKRSRRSKVISLTKVRLAMPVGEVVREVLILELNALLLMNTGRVYYFSSVKSMHAIEWLCDVRCLAKTQTGFSVIRLRNKNTLHLEIYKDVANLGKSVSTLQQSYDITYDAQNLFNCQWRDEHFTLLTCTVQEANLSFLQLLVGSECKLYAEQVLHLFTVSGMVFAVIPASSSMNIEDAVAPYHIQRLFNYASAVQFIKLDFAQQRCLIFLESGSIDIFYISRLIPVALQRLTHHTGAQYTSCVYATNQHSFYFTDEQQVVQLQFLYDASNDTCQVQETYKAIPGIVACTWVDTLEQLICLSCNNVFYKITFENAAMADTLNADASISLREYENLNALYELTPARMSKLLAHAQITKELTQLPAQLHTAIEQEFVQQQLLAVASKQQLYANLCKASVSYSMHLPTASASAGFTLVYTNDNLCLDNKSLLAIIQLQIKSSDIFQNALWHLHIDYNNHAYLMHIPHNLLQQNLRIVFPLKRQSARQLVPMFELKLYALVKQEKEFVAITLPVKVQVDADSYVSLFSLEKRASTLSNKYDVEGLISHFKQQQKNVKTVEPKRTTHKVIAYTLSLPQKCSFSSIQQSFGARATENAVNFEIYFMDKRVNIAFNESVHSIDLESNDVVALYYTKLHLLYNVPHLGSNAAIGSLKELIMQLQCDLPRCTTTTTLEMTNLAELQATQVLQLESLQRIYGKLRRDTGTLYT